MPLAALNVRTGSTRCWDAGVDTGLVPALTALPVPWAPEPSKEPFSQATEEAWPGPFSPPQQPETTAWLVGRIGLWIFPRI